MYLTWLWDELEGFGYSSRTKHGLSIVNFQPNRRHEHLGRGVAGYVESEAILPRKSLVYVLEVVVRR